jgi:hypothetical protein
MAHLPIITSPPGFYVVAATVINGVCEVELTPVIGWQCGVTPRNADATGEDAFFLLSFPVIPNCALIEGEFGRAHFILHPDGRVSDGSRIKFENIDAAKKFLVAKYKLKRAR